MNWNKDWDEVAGLWFKTGPGHTVETKNLKILHPGPDAASRLLEAARRNALGEIDSERVLRSLYGMQWKKTDDFYGCMKWYLEEDNVCDGNAGFFTGLSLIILRICFYEHLNPGSRKVLDDILAGLNVWFRNALQYAEFYYPNKYLGDLACKWLLLEILGNSPEDDFLPDQMREAASYYQKHHWGWGEHLSDGYCTVCLNELSLLLLLSKQLPEDLRRSYQQLTDELLEIEDIFAGGPRVPALRSYAFTAPEEHEFFRDSVTADKPEETVFYNMPDLGPLLYEWGWHDVMPPRKKTQRDIRIPCFAGSMATARVEKDIRLGVMSRFPLMPTAEHAAWGLSWQCFPVAISRGKTDWGFLQWETQEGGRLHAHPANGGPNAHIPKALSDMMSPPVFGQTFALQRGPDALILRVMREIPQSWESITDRFRLLSMTADVEELNMAGWHQILLNYPERVVSVSFIPLSECEESSLVRTSANGLDWNHSLTGDSPLLHNQRMILHLWAVSLDGKIDSPPNITVLKHHNEPRSKEERIRVIDWKWKNTRWHVTIDPLSDNIMQEIPEP